MKKCIKVASTLLGVVAFFSIVSCSKEKELNYPEFLTEKSWVYENNICAENLWFGSEGNYSYYESCGNPVGNSDLYETYSYEEETGIITVYPCEAEMDEMMIEVLRYDENSLLVKIDDGIKEFCINGSIPYLDAETCDYIEDYSSYEAIVELEDDSVVTAPASYDGDVASDKEKQRKVKLSNDVEYYELYIETIETEDEVTSTHEYYKMSIEEVEQLLEGTLGMGFVWYNEEMEIEKIIFFGELIIYQ